MRLRPIATAATVLALGGLAACGHDKPTPRPTTVTPTVQPSTSPTRTVPPPTSPGTVTPTGCGLFNPTCGTPTSTPTPTDAGTTPVHGG